MFINLMRGVYLTDEEFAAEMAKRREVLGLADGEVILGCPLCGTLKLAPADNAGGGQ
jgi:hypothetical protein